LLRAAARLAPPEMTVTVFNGLGELPLFNPDHEANPFGTVATFRSYVANADALLIASPEYDRTTPPEGKPGRYRPKWWMVRRSRKQSPLLCKNAHRTSPDLSEAAPIRGTTRSIRRVRLHM
jgi:hypothetical protein